MFTNVFDRAMRQYFGATVVAGIVFPLILFFALLYYKIADLNTLSTFVDSIFKVIIVIVGALWVLNRNLIRRVDYSHLKVDCTVALISGKSFRRNNSRDLLVLRLDVHNPSQTILPEGGHRVQVSLLQAFNENVKYRPIHHWPQEGHHPSGPIEPNSWAAISDAIPVPANTKAIRVYYERKDEHGNIWNWHSIYVLTPQPI